MPVEQKNKSTIPVVLLKIMVSANVFISIWLFVWAIYMFFQHPQKVLSDLAYKTDFVSAMNFEMLQNLEYKMFSIFLLLVSIYYILITIPSILSWFNNNDRIKKILKELKDSDTENVNIVNEKAN
jgi:hypothetical protein